MSSYIRVKMSPLSICRWENVRTFHFSFSWDHIYLFTYFKDFLYLRERETMNKEREKQTPH